MNPDDPHRQLAAALGRIPSGIYVLTVTRGPVETGLLASWVQQCSFEPPQVSVAIRPGREIAGLLERGSRFTLNILEASQTDMIVHFGRGFALTQDAFAGLEVRRDPQKGPVLTEALAYLECEVVGRFGAGDHDLFVGRVLAGELLDEGQPMVHIRKNGLHY
jgi:flavin reductase (DIM6/NTAB) family NADH-FMN oxidoreductase RutF